MRSVVPGLILVAALAVVARGATLFLPGYVSEITIGVLAGIVVRNTLRPSVAYDAGIRFASNRLLRLGIVLLGARLSFEAIVSTGVSALLIIVVCVAAALGLTMLLARALGLPMRLATLIAVGTAICGNSAIVATAPVIGARSRDVSFAVGTITLFGVAAVIVYPIAGTMMGLSDGVFGHWAGVAVNDTSQVTAAGFAYSDPAGSTATIVKLTRNTLLGPMVIAIGLLYAHANGPVGSVGRGPLGRAFQFLPLFVIGFLFMAVLNSVGLIPSSLADLLGEVSRVLILLALVAVGLGTDLRSIGEVGMRPMYVGFGVAVAIALLALALSLWLVG